MTKSIISGIILLLIAVCLMGFRVFFTKNGKFPNSHIDANEVLKKRGIKCALNQDRDEYCGECPFLQDLNSNDK